MWVLLLTNHAFAPLPNYEKTQSYEHLINMNKQEQRKTNKLLFYLFVQLKKPWNLIQHNQPITMKI